MNLNELVLRGTPRPWSEGDNIPWNDPGFSERMLIEHLSQDHDAASRRLETVDRHIRFIQQHGLAAPAEEFAGGQFANGLFAGGQLARILDLGCGPGLYACRLAQLGHTVHGIDFSPASIAYARQSAESAGLNCTFTLGDVRSTPYPDENNMAMFIYGEFNVFSPSDARAILIKARNALCAGGRLLLEPHTEDFLRGMGSKPPTWYTAESGLFSENPHLMLQEAFWDERAKVVTNRHILIDAATSQVTRYAASYQAYSLLEYQELLQSCGFTKIEIFPSLTGEDEAGGLFAIVAQ